MGRCIGSTHKNGHRRPQKNGRDNTDLSFFADVDGRFFAGEAVLPWPFFVAADDSFYAYALMVRIMRTVSNRMRNIPIIIPKPRKAPLLMEFPTLMGSDTLGRWVFADDVTRGRRWDF